jgi:Flp pilus assembly protein TadB
MRLKNLLGMGVALPSRQLSTGGDFFHHKLDRKVSEGHGKKIRRKDTYIIFIFAIFATFAVAAVVAIIAIIVSILFLIWLTNFVGLTFIIIVVAALAFIYSKHSV